MKAAVLEKVGKLVVKEVEEPEVLPGTLLVKVHAATICNQTDRHIIEGVHPPFVYPQILGHEGAGEVVEIGEGIEGFEIGYRVLVRANGVFAEYIRVSPDVISKVSSALPYEEISCTELLGPISGLASIHIRLGDEVVILGQGAAGMLMTQSVKAAGAVKVIASEIDERKWDLAHEFGADELINSQKSNLKDTVDKLTNGKGADVVIDTAGVPETIGATPDLASGDGRIVIFGVCCSGKICIDFLKLHQKWLPIHSTGSEARGYAYSPESYEHAIRLAESGLIKLKPLITHTFPLEQVNAAFDLIEKKTELVIKVVLHIGE